MLCSAESLMIPLPQSQIHQHARPIQMCDSQEQEGLELSTSHFWNLSAFVLYPTWVCISVVNSTVDSPYP